MKDDFPYENLHDYLDEVFLDKIPSKEEVQKEKRQYRRMYNTALKRYIRKRKVHLTLSLEQAEHRKLEKQARMFGISLYDYIRNSALKAKSPQSMVNVGKLNELRVLTAQIVSKLEDALEESQPDLNTIFQDCLKLEKAITQINDY